MVKKKGHATVEQSEEAKAKKKFDFSKVNYWMVATVLLAIILLVFISVDSFSTISKKTAGETVTNFLVSAYGLTASDVNITSVTSEGDIYLVNFSVQSQGGTFAVSNDGDYVGQMIAISTFKKVATTTTNTPASTDVPKSDKPKVELYVMSYCPYGVRAENNILPLVKLLKDVVDFKVRFIVTMNGDAISGAKSLHGLYEAKQDAVQMVIQQKYSSKFWSYIEAFNTKCYSLGYSDTAKADTCWKAEATKLGIDAKAVETAAYGAEGVSLLKAEEAASQSAGASGSPTLVINGVQSQAIYSGTEATQSAICGAFNKAPSVCGEVVTSTAAAPTGSC